MSRRRRPAAYAAQQPYSAVARAPVIDLTHEDTTTELLPRMEVVDLTESAASGGASSHEDDFRWPEADDRNPQQGVVIYRTIVSLLETTATTA